MVRSGLTFVFMALVLSGCSALGTDGYDDNAMPAQGEQQKKSTLAGSSAWYDELNFVSTRKEPPIYDWPVIGTADYLTKNKVGEAVEGRRPDGRVASFVVVEEYSSANKK